jgi:tetratricopeptide (TPR) repeat protein
MSDILQLQGRVARAIAEEVHAILTPDDLARLSRLRVANPEAHVAYLKGRFHLRQWTRESIAKGFEYLHQAIAIDPRCAPAYVQLAEGLAVLGYWGHLPQQRAYTEAKAAVSRALEFDDWLSDAHAILGMVCWLLDWDMDRCEHEMRRALELNRSSPLAHLLYANFLVTMRKKREEALREAALALEFDPLSVNTNFTFAYKLLFAGEYERAFAQAVSTLETFPDCLHAWYVRGWAELGRGHPAAAAAAFEKAVLVSPDAFSVAYLAHALGRSGQTNRARAMLDDLLARRASDYVAEFVFVLVYSGLGEIDAAFDSMEKCYAERDSRLFWLQVVPCFHPLRSDRRYDDLVRRLQLPPEAIAKGTTPTLG